MTAGWTSIIPDAAFPVTDGYTLYRAAVKWASIIYLVAVHFKNFKTPGKGTCLSPRPSTLNPKPSTPNPRP